MQTPADRTSQSEDDAIRAVHRSFIKHPHAARALMGVLEAEGRRYATTVEGRELYNTVIASSIARRLSTFMDIVSSGVLGRADSNSLPSALFESVARAVVKRRFEARTQRVIDRDDL